MVVKQMTFEVLLNPSILEEDKIRLKGQAGEIWRLLQKGPVSNSELASISLRYGARIGEIRHKIVRKDLMIDAVCGEGGEIWYEIVRLDKSAFWKKVQQKEEEYKWL